MKEYMKKLSDICKVIFGYGIMISLFAGGITFFGYLAAVIIGGETAAMICQVIYKQIMPLIVRVTSLIVLFGLVSMYLAGEKSLTPSGRKKYSASKKQR